MTELQQYGPYPNDLEDVVARLRYRPSWTFRLEDIERDPESSHGAAAGGLTFIVTTSGYNAYRPERGQTYRVNHYFVVPAATYNQASWLRWVFDCLVKVETHETMEFFALVRPSEEATIDARYDRPYAPTHGPGDDPYVVHEYATDLQQRTRFTGEVVASSAAGTATTINPDDFRHPPGTFGTQA